MGLYEQIGDELKAAMRAGDKVRLAAIRGIRAGFIEKMKQDNAESVSDEDAMAVLRRLAKQHRESVDAYTKAGRLDLVAEEQGQLDVIDAYLPKLADEETTRSWVAQAVASTGASGPGDMGKVMGALMKAHRGDIDGKLANRLVREALA